jgi:NodT family efflux transporter outer membrane factor (OMF) lipoprotein
MNCHDDKKIGATPSGGALAALALACLLSACAAGPEYERPPLDLPRAYAPPADPAASPPPSTPELQRFAVQDDIAANWWTLFRSPPLNALIARAFAAHPGIDAAQAALRAAQENVDAQQGFSFPTVAASYTPTRTKLAGNLGGNSPGVQGNGAVISTAQGTPARDGGAAPFNAPVIYNFHTAQLTVGFVPDVFGANRRQVESLESQRRAQRFQLEATYVTLASNIVAAAVEDALLRAQIATATQMIEADTQALALTLRQRNAGFASRLDLALAQNALALSRQALAPLQKQFAQNRDMLRALTATPQDSEPPAFDLDALTLPAQLPLSLPSHLIEQRPDVRAAEELVRSASAQVGVAHAARFPQFSINANAGGAASQFSQMFWNSGKFFDVAGNLTAPLFDGGTLKHREGAASEALRGAAAQYRVAVSTAIQNVADVLAAIEADTSALSAAQSATTAANEVLELTQRQHAHGYLDRLALIAAEQTHRQALLALAQAQANRLGDSAALFQALGGGWWNKPADAIDQARSEPTSARAQASSH